MMDIKNSIQSGTADTPVAPHRDRSNQQRSLPWTNVTRFPRLENGARPLTRDGQDLSELGTQAEGEQQPRQRQSQRGPQTDDAEIGGCSHAEMSYAEPGQELTLIFSYGSRCDLLRHILQYERSWPSKGRKSERVFDRLVGQIPRLHHQFEGVDLGQRRARDPTTRSCKHGQGDCR
jgi:hypothetical protein